MTQITIKTPNESIENKYNIDKLNLIFDYIQEIKHIDLNTFDNIVELNIHCFYTFKKQESTWNDLYWDKKKIIIQKNILSIDSKFIKKINCNYSNICDLILLPKTLEKLQISENKLTFIPEIIKELKFLKILKCSSNPIKNLNSLNSLPENLVHLEICNCNIDSIEYLPLNLEILKINNNNIMCINLNYLSRLKILECINNKITDLGILPQKLEILKCSINKIINLDNLPDSLVILESNSNQLTKLDNLPSTLKILHCTSNQLTELDFLPGGLELLNVSNNKLTYLDNLPSCLEILIVSSNPISNLNNLPPNLKKIKICGESNITELLNLPANLEEIIVLKKKNLSLHSPNSQIKCNYNNLKKIKKIIINEFVFESK